VSKDLLFSGKTPVFLQVKFAGQQHYEQISNDFGRIDLQNEKITSFLEAGQD
jgi:hypothetical protein